MDHVRAAGKTPLTRTICQYFTWRFFLGFEDIHSCDVNGKICGCLISGRHENGEADTDWKSIDVINISFLTREKGPLLMALRPLDDEL